MHAGSPITSAERIAIQSLLGAIAPFGEIPLPYVKTFLAIVLEEGKSQSAYGRAVGIGRVDASRHIHALGDRARHGGPGCGLIRLERAPDKMKNAHRIYLTAKGRALAAEIFRNLKRHQGAMVA